ncbi:MAG: T9SS type A sorting domain-containing protein [Bacteroidota bacterium]|nr:T9SS type A sorting domain-containing protein [Bacteroidota bacterium]
MKIIIFFICFTILSLNLTGQQKKALFEMYFYFKDAAEHKDTIFFRADSSIIDDGSTSSDDYNPEWGEIIDNTPLDSSFEVRAKPLESIGGNFYQNLINKAYDDGRGCIAPQPLLIFVYTKFWPITMSWDQAYFRNHPCLYGSDATPDVDMAQKWLFNDPVPIRPIACLGNSSSYTKDLRETVLEKDFELPYIIQYQVKGIGIQNITALRVEFRPSWLHLCDSLTSTNNLEQLYATIYPTVVSNEIHIVTFSMELKTCTIIGIEGKIITELKFLDDIHTINLQSLEPGIYFLRLTDKNGKTISKKFIKS